MPEQLEDTFESNPEETPTSNPINSAVARCNDAWERTYKASLAVEKHRVAALMVANRAYCRAMPPLSGAQNIRDFIACVADGMLINVIHEKSASKLLYAAQMAHNTLPKRPPRAKKPSA
ncbi:MAG: hypothetical protein WB608_08775 [Terracidiphilus sp.]